MKGKRTTTGLLMNAASAVFDLVTRLVFATWRGLGRVWKCRRPSPDPLDWTFRFRDLLGIAVLIAVKLTWRMQDIDPSAELNSALSGRVASVIILSVVVPAVALTFALIARRGQRLRAWSLSAIPIVTVVTTGGAIAGPTLISQSQPWHALSNWLSETIADGGARGTLIAFALGLLVITYGVVQATALVAAIVMSLSSSFRAADAHPLMAPVVGLALAGYAAMSGVWQRMSGAEPSLPVWVAWVITLGGPATVVALSMWQIGRLRATGFRFRESPWPATGDPISSAMQRLLLTPSVAITWLRSRPRDGLPRWP